MAEEDERNKKNQSNMESEDSGEGRGFAGMDEEKRKEAARKGGER